MSGDVFLQIWTCSPINPLNFLVCEMIRLVSGYMADCRFCNKRYDKTCNNEHAPHTVRKKLAHPTTEIQLTMDLGSCYQYNASGNKCHAGKKGSSFCPTGFWSLNLEVLRTRGIYACRTQDNGSQPLYYAPYPLFFLF